MGNKTKEFLLTLFLGQPHARPKTNLRPAIKNQCFNILRIWKNKYHSDFGIERIVRLLLALLIFIPPGLYVRAFFGKFGLLGRKLGVELYVLIKLLLPILFFKLDWTHNPVVAFISGWMAIETVIYLSALIFLSNEFAKPISYRRSLISVFINYVEICLDFAVLYSYFNYTIPDFFKQKVTTDIQVIYFSFVTSATVGYGDIHPVNEIGQILVILQIILFLFFAGLFISFFASKVHDPTYYNAKQNYSDKWQKPNRK